MIAAFLAAQNTQALFGTRSSQKQRNLYVVFWAFGLLSHNLKGFKVFEQPGEDMKYHGRIKCLKHTNAYESAKLVRVLRDSIWVLIKEMAIHQIFFSICMYGIYHQVNDNVLMLLALAMLTLTLISYFLFNMIHDAK